MIYLDKNAVESMCHTLAVTLFDEYNEPIPPFELHDATKLEAILSNPERIFNGKDLYPVIEDKAAILYYGMIKGHSFNNGNKRIATTSLLVFLAINGKWMNVPKKDLENMAINVAASKGNEKDRILILINKWIKNNLEDY